MITLEQYESVLDAATTNMALQQNWRWGQSVFNTLLSIHPTIAEEIRGTIFDMYYNDENVEKFKNYLIKPNEDES